MSSKSLETAITESWDSDPVFCIHRRSHLFWSVILETNYRTSTGSALIDHHLHKILMGSIPQSDSVETFDDWKIHRPALSSSARDLKS